MMTQFERVTIKNKVEFSGFGVHSAKKCSAFVNPGDQGIVFIHQRNKILASPYNVTSTENCTAIGGIRMIEHMMSALAGLGITDAEIVVDGEELPILDGSSKEYVEGFLSVESLPLKKFRAFSLYQRVFFRDHNAEIAISFGEGRWKYCFEKQDRWPGEQVFGIKLSKESYVSDVASARTFILEEDIAPVVAAGLGKAATTENTLILLQNGYKTEPRFLDEPARHKLLDCIGDLALVGVPVRYLNVTAQRSGHKHNVEAAKQLSQVVDWKE